MTTYTKIFTEKIDLDAMSSCRWLLKSNLIDSRCSVSWASVCPCTQHIKDTNMIPGEHRVQSLKHVTEQDWTSQMKSTEITSHGLQLSQQAFRQGKHCLWGMRGYKKLPHAEMSLFRHFLSDSLTLCLTYGTQTIARYWAQNTAHCHRDA